MALVMKAFILCATDDPAAAEAAVYGALNGGVFESDDPILDFAIGVDHAVVIGEDYQDGAMETIVPAVRFLRPANSPLLPC